jgi:hypothetical protein
MRIDEVFHTAYRELEERMRALAEADGDVFLPNPEPLGPAHYVLIQPFFCLESFAPPLRVLHGVDVLGCGRPV